MIRNICILSIIYFPTLSSTKKLGRSLIEKIDQGMLVRIKGTHSHLAQQRPPDMGRVASIKVISALLLLQSFLPRRVANTRPAAPPPTTIIFGTMASNGNKIDRN
jgi:hypothetical protein